MSGALTTTPPSTQAHILRKLAASRYPKLDKPNVAASHHMSLGDLDAILTAHGWPDPQQMLKHADQLDEQARADSDAEPGRLSQVALGRLHPDPNNPREQLHDVEELAESMREVGLLQPIVARRHEGRLIVVAGHRRLAAARLLRWATVECIVREDMKPDDVLAAMIVENGQRRDLDPIEEARAYRRLKSQLGDVPDTEVARRVGRSNQHVTERLVLLTLPPEEQDEIRNGVMSLTEARQRARIGSGRTRPNAVGRPGVGHLSATHPLGVRAKNRCVSLKHSRGKAKGVGGMACGACWEHVIRADERDQLHAKSEQRGRCVLCDTTHDPDATGAAR